MEVASSYAGRTVVDKRTPLVGVYGLLGSDEIELEDGVALGKSVTKSIDLTGHAITANGDFTLASPGGSLSSARCWCSRTTPR